MRTGDITSVTQHRDHLRDHLNQVKKTGRPMFITNRGGETEAVMLSAESYDEMMEQVELVRSLALIDKSMENVESGQGKDFRRAIHNISDKLDLNMPQ